MPFIVKFDFANKPAHQSYLLYQDAGPNDLVTQARATRFETREEALKAVGETAPHCEIIEV